MKDNRGLYVVFSARLNAIKKPLGTDNNIGQATTHKAVEMFWKFLFALVSGDTCRSRWAFLAMVNNLKLTNINGGRHNASIMIKNTGRGITKLFLEIMYITTVGMSNIEKTVRILRLVTDMR